MCRKLSLLLSCAMVFGLSSSVLAATYDFGGWSSDSWHLGSEWWTGDGTPGNKPGPGDNAWIHAAGVDCTFYGTSNESVTNVSIGYQSNPTGNNTLTFMAGLLEVADNFSVGSLWSDWGGWNTGTLECHGGEIQASGNVYVGQWTDGVANIHNGRVWGQWGVNIGAYGTVNLNGGILESFQWLNMANGGSITISDGDLYVNGAYTGEGAKDQVLSYISNGWIAADTGYTLQSETYAFGADTGIHVWAVPEPMTIMLLGLGGLGLLRRKNT